MSSSSDENDSFKTSWNYFTCFVYEFIESRFESNQKEKQKFTKELLDCPTHPERIKLIWKDEILKEKIVAAVDESIKKVPLPQEKQNFYEMATKQLNDMHCADYRKMVESLTRAISLLLSDMSNPMSYDLLVDCLLKRADLLYTLERYEDCYEEIKELKSLNVPSEDMLLIPGLERNCLKQLSKINLIVKPNEIEVSEENPRLESCTINAEMIYKEEKGRAVRSTQLIPAKTLIAAEDAFVSWLRPNAYNEYCNHCLLKLNSRYIFCNDCFVVRYCSVECRGKSWNNYHEKECRYISAIKDWSMGHMALRMALVGGIDTVIEMEKSGEKIALQNWPQMSFRSNYASIHSLTGEQCLLDDYYSAAAVGATFLALFSSRINLIDENNEDFYVFGGVIFKHIAQVYLNTYTVYDQDMRRTQFSNIYTASEDRNKIGVALYGSSSLFSHSCESNCLKYYCGSKIVIVNSVPINQNEEITVNYGTCCSQNTIQDRNDFLMSNFGFECKCEACDINLECIAYAFICPLCKGPLICNENGTNYCGSCLQEEVDITEILKLSEEAKKLVSDGEELVASANFDKAKDCYTKAEHIYKRIYYNPNRLFAVNSSLVILEEAKGNFYKAYKYKTTIDAIISETYGDESLELIDHFVECGQLLKKVAKQVLLKKRKYLKKSEAYFEEAFKVFTRASKAEFQIVANTRTSFIDFITI